jgi:hypothetical protein
MQLSRSLIFEVRLAPHGRAIHFGTKRTFSDVRVLSVIEGNPDIQLITPTGREHSPFI